MFVFRACLMFSIFKASHTGIWQGKSQEVVTPF